MIRLRTRSTVTVAAIGMTQTLAWGSSYYLPAILADPIAAGLDVPKSLFFGFFSGALLLQAALGPMIGKAIDRHGGRGSEFSTSSASRIVRTSGHGGDKMADDGWQGKKR